MGECWFAYILTEKWLWKFILVKDNAADGYIVGKFRKNKANGYTIISL